jgi:hypothetical protein
MWRISIGFLVFVLTATAESGAQARGEWSTHQDSQFGFTYSYPAQLFIPEKGERPSFHYFRSNHTDAKLMFGAWNNGSGSTPEEFKRWMLTHAGGYEDITYQPRGRSWFVMSGHRSDQIYYEKAIFSCSRRVVNVFAIAYPEAERSLFDPIVERMEDSFETGRGCG